MSGSKRRQLDALRTDLGPYANTLIDEFADGEMDRGDFIRRAVVGGMSASLIGTRWPRSARRRWRSRAAAPRRRAGGCASASSDRLPGPSSRICSTTMVTS